MQLDDLSRRRFLARGAAGIVVANAGSLIAAGAASAAPATRPVVHAVANVYKRGVKTRKAVALTFDAGSDVGYAAGILDVLKANGIHASFGMTGQWAQRNPELARRVIAEGHHLINHTMSHVSFTYGAPGRRPLKTADRWKQLDQAEEVFHSVMGVGSNGWFRPPYMAWDLSCAWDCADHGWDKIALQTVDSGGWKSPPWQEVHYRCTRLAVNGAIYVFHVGRGATDYQALPGIIAALRKDGYSFETVAEIVRP